MEIHFADFGARFLSVGIFGIIDLEKIMRTHQAD
jgi:hypothetical protein